jgi:hypothetical protein
MASSTGTSQGKVYWRVPLGSTFLSLGTLKWVIWKPGQSNSVRPIPSRTPTADMQQTDACFILLVKSHVRFPAIPALRR